MGKSISALILFFKKKESFLLLVLVIACVSLLGWMIGETIVASGSRKFIPIAPSSSLLFIALSILSLNIISESKPGTQNSTAFVLTVALSFCVYILLDSYFNFTWDPEAIFIKTPGKLGYIPTGRMSPITALMFIFICISIWGTRNSSRKIFKYLGGIFSSLTTLLSIVLLTGYLYNAPLLYGGQTIPVSLPSAICFLLFSFTLLRTYELQTWAFNLTVRNHTGYQLLKSFLPIVVFVVILQGYIMTNFSINQNNPTLVTALILFVIVALTIVIIFRVSNMLGDKLQKTEKERNEKMTELLEAYKQLEQYSFDNKELKQFAYISSHQLQQPLRTIKNFVQVFEEDYHTLFDENAIKYLHTIKHSAERMNSLILSLSDYSRLGHNLKLESVDFNELVNNVISDLDAIIRSSGAVIEVSDMPVMKAYEVEIRQVFQNLIANAIKYRRIDAQVVIQVKAEKLSNKYKFSVCDNGIGIPPTQYKRVFDMFQRLHVDESEYEGKGIGLAFCKKIVELHQGEIWVEPNAGEGVTLFFTIPNLKV